MTRALPRALLCTLLLTIAGVAEAAPGILDPTFGLGGKVTTSIGNNDASASAVLVQPDGKLVAVGSSDILSGSDFALVRYNADGTLDPGFGSGGRIITPVGIGSARATDAALQPDGKVVAVGFASTGAGSIDFALVRYNGDGTLDAGFGTGGKVTTPIGSGVFDVANGVALQPDGRLVAAGYADTGGKRDFALVRYNADGTLDVGFGSGGTVTTPIGSSFDEAEAVALQPDGKVVAVGSSRTAGGFDFVLARYHADGMLDVGFGSGGIVTTPVGIDSARATAIALQPDGKLVAVGTAYSSSSQTFLVVRYHADGTLDAGFGSSGKVTTPIGSGFPSAYGVALQPDGKLVVAGSASNLIANFALVRYNADGTLDAGFGSGGKVTTPIWFGIAFAAAVVVQADGKLVAVGPGGSGSSSDFALARYEGGPTPDCGADTDSDGVCDAIDNCDAIVNPTQENGDADALGDACDPCTNLVATTQERAKLIVSKLAAPTGDDTVTFKGFFRDIPATPVIDPVANGLRFLITDRTGVAPVDLTIPGGVYDSVNKVGWKVNPGGTRWTYKNAGNPLPLVNGIQTAQLKASRSVAGEYKFAVKGKNGNYPIDTANLPLVGTIVIDPPLATTGQCGEVLFWGVPQAKPNCVATTGAMTVRCK